MSWQSGASGFWRPILAVAAAALLAVGLAAQDRQGGRGFGGRGLAPARDNQQQTQGTSVISGRIVSLDTGSPLRRAQVRLSSPEMRIGRVATTNSEGRYEFRDLPAGRFTLTASKTGYLTLNYGQRRPLEPGTPIDLGEGREVGRADITLPRGSVITGTIVDEYGEALPDVTVQAMRYEYVGGQRQLRPTGRTALTNDIGQFRIFGLPPADYYVTATVPRGNRIRIANARAEIIDFVGRGGVPGRIVSELQALAAGQSDDGSGYAPTYYPGTPDVSQAQRVTVGIAEEMSGISFGMLAVQLARISGTVIDSQGAPFTRGVVTLRPSTGGPSVLGGAGAGVVRGGGAFTIDDVPPGNYILQVQSRGRGRGRGGNEGTSGEFARVELGVNGTDIDQLIIATSAGATVAGTVSFGPSVTAPAPSRLSISAVSTDAEPLAAQGGRLQDDGSFTLTGLGGNYLFRPNNVPSGWVLESVRLDGRDITDTPYEFRGGMTVGNLDVELTAEITEIDGSVVDGRGEPVGGYTAVVFARDSTLWGPQSRHVRTARPDQEGRFEILGLPPGSYLAVAVEYLEQGSESDPYLLEELASGASSFSLDAGETYKLELKY